jgi:hypothetical protein
VKKNKIYKEIKIVLFLVKVFSAYLTEFVTAIDKVLKTAKTSKGAAFISADTLFLTLAGF